MLPYTRYTSNLYSHEVRSGSSVHSWSVKPLLKAIWNKNFTRNEPFK